MNQSISYQQQQQQQETNDQQTKRRRYRIPRSCDRCRTSKIKCVFQDGKCAACVTARVACTFANPGSLKERPPTQKDLEHLQARIRSLERLIHAIDPKLDLTNLPDSFHRRRSSSTNQNRHHRSSTLPGPTPSTQTYIAPSTSINNPYHRSSFTTDSHGLISGPELNSIFSPTRVILNDSPANLSTALCKPEDLSPVDFIIRREYQRALPPNHLVYPEPDLERALLEIFFTDFHPVFTVIHPASFFNDFKAGLSHTNESFRALSFMVFAIASRFSKDPRVYLDMEGNPHSSPQIAGIRYSMSGGSYLFRPIATPATLYDLQAILLLIVYMLGTVSPSLTWHIIGLGVQKAQEIGAHLENNTKWANDPIQNHLRRKVFLILYEFDCMLSSTLGRPAYMQESDFDVAPPDPDFEAAAGIFTNPWTKQPGVQQSEQGCEIYSAYYTMKSSLAGFKNLLPVMNAMSAQKDQDPETKFSSRVRSLVDQLDASMTRCFDKLSPKLKGLFESDIDGHDLVSSVFVISWYHEFRLLIHRVLFNYKEKTPLDKEGRKSKTKRPYFETCVESASKIVNMIDRLKDKNLLELGFFWIPIRLTTALIVLICSLNKQRRASSVDRNRRCFEISLGIQILNILAPSTYIAGRCSNMMVQLYQSALQLDESNEKSMGNHGSSSTTFSPSSSSSASPPTELKAQESTTNRSMTEEMNRPDGLDGPKDSKDPLQDYTLHSYLNPGLFDGNMLKNPLLISNNTFDFSAFESSAQQQPPFRQTFSS